MLNIFIGSSSSTYPNETEFSDDDNDSMIGNTAHSSRKYRHLINDSEEEESSQPTLVVPKRNRNQSSRKDAATVAEERKPFKGVKLESDNVPFPDPFPLPEHYRSDVEAALKTGKMTSETRSCFMSSIASAMLRYKLYPSRDDYVSVALTILRKYPFFKSTTGTAYVSLTKH